MKEELPMSMPHQVHEICIGFCWAVRSQAPPPPWLEGLNSLRSRKSKVPGRVVFFTPQKEACTPYERGRTVFGRARASRACAEMAWDAPRAFEPLRDRLKWLLWIAGCV